MAIISGINAGSSEGGGGVSPDYIPPSIKYKDADEIYVQKGRYNKAGYRFEGQYQDLANITDYWDVETMFTIAVDNTYSAGTLSGTLGGLVNSSWYSVFMVASDEIVVLPFIRVDAIAYSAPSTTINPASHADGTTAENGWVTSNDIFNNYRLLLINDDPTESGNVYTIADCATGTPDTIVIAGDITADVAATEWLQMIPQAATPCLYLGFIGIDASGNLLRFNKPAPWLTTFEGYISINLNKALSGDASNTDIGIGAPPVAKRVGGLGYIYSATSNYGVRQYFYSRAGGSLYNFMSHHGKVSYGALNHLVQNLTLDINEVSKVCNASVYMTNDAATEAALDAGGATSLRINAVWE